MDDILNNLSKNNYYNSLKNISNHKDIIAFFRPVKLYSINKSKITNTIKKLLNDDISEENKMNIIRHFKLIDYISDL